MGLQMTILQQYALWCLNDEQLCMCRNIIAFATSLHLQHLPVHRMAAKPEDLDDSVLLLPQTLVLAGLQ